MSTFKQVLESLNLEQYFEQFHKIGCTDISFVKSLSNEQLQNMCKLFGMRLDDTFKLIKYFEGEAKPNTYIGMVVDRSGSMSSIIEDVIGGYNKFIEDQKKLGTATINIIKFDDKIDHIYKNVAIDTVPKADKTTFTPRGTTALYDAIKLMINSADNYLKEKKQYSKIMIVILTDGAENCSRMCSAGELRKLIQDREKRLNWEFLFLSANKDAIFEGTKLGMKRSNCIDWSRSKSDQVFEATSNYVKRMRIQDSSLEREFTQEERESCIDL